MTFDNSVKTCLRKSFTFKGRASRSEYWYFCLFQLLFIIIVGLFVVATRIESDSAIIIIIGLPYICSLPAAISVEVRRFHDLNKSGWNFWWGMIPYIGGFILLYFMIQPSYVGDNEYGSMPE